MPGPATRWQRRRRAGRQEPLRERCLPVSRTGLCSRGRSAAQGRGSVAGAARGGPGRAWLGPLVARVREHAGSGRGSHRSEGFSVAVSTVVSEAKQVTVPSLPPAPAVQIAPGELALVCSLRKMVQNDWVSTVPVRWPRPWLRKGHVVIVRTPGLDASGRGLSGLSRVTTPKPVRLVGWCLLSRLTRAPLRQTSLFHCRCSSALVQSVLSSYQLGERSGRIKITQLLAVRARPTLAAGQGSPGCVPGRGGRHCPASSDRLLLLAERRRHRADPEPDRVRLQAPESPSAPGAAGRGQAPERLPSAAEDTAHCFWVLGVFFDIVSDLEQNHIPV